MLCNKCNTIIKFHYEEPNLILEAEDIDKAIQTHREINLKIQLFLSSVFLNFTNNGKCGCGNINLYYHDLINTNLLKMFLKFGVRPRNYDEEVLVKNCLENITEKNKYSRYFYGLPIALKNANISIENYNLRQQIYLEDSIKGHPKASHGWFQESLEDLERMGIFLV